MLYDPPSVGFRADDRGPARRRAGGGCVTARPARRSSRPGPGPCWLVADLGALGKRLGAVLDAGVVHDQVLALVVGRDEPEALSSLNHLTVPVAVMDFPPGAVAGDTREVLDGNDCDAGTASPDGLPGTDLIGLPSRRPIAPAPRRRASRDVHWWTARSSASVLPLTVSKSVRLHQDRRRRPRPLAVHVASSPARARLVDSPAAEGGAGRARRPRCTAPSPKLICARWSSPIRTHSESRTPRRARTVAHTSGSMGTGTAAAAE